MKLGLSKVSKKKQTNMFKHIDESEPVTKATKAVGYLQD